MMEKYQNIVIGFGKGGSTKRKNECKQCQKE